MRRWCAIGSRFFAALLASATLHAQAPPVDASAGRSVSAVIDDLRRTGLPLAYSTALLPPTVAVTQQPAAADPIELVRELLAPHGLVLRWTDGLYVVARAPRSAARVVPGAALVTVRNGATGAPLLDPEVAEPSDGLAVERLPAGRLRLVGEAGRRYGVTLSVPGFAPVRRSIALTAAGATIEVELWALRDAPAELVVTASRYELSNEQASRPFLIDGRTLDAQPDLGDDPLRALHRLPGMAAGGASAKAHVRGGEQEESAIVLNGQQLLDPFHIRDYQSLFSAIDLRAVEAIEVYTGAFPARYGDRLGALVLIDAISAAEPRQTELGLSVFNTSALSAGTVGDGTGSWLVSARRGNLDWVLNEELGEPSYYDFFGEIAVNFSPRNTVAVNALTARDRVHIVTESDPTELEESTNDTRNLHFWVHWRQQWTSALDSSTVFSSSRFDSRRIGRIDGPQKIVGRVDDRRDVAINGVRQDWTLALGERHTLTWGGEYQQLAADYDYGAYADYFELFATFVGVPTTIRRAADVAADGELFSVYFADRWQIADSWRAELGWRWDKQGYTDTPNERQFSPRVSVLHELGVRTDLRFGFGRYYQSHGIHELQVEDGVREFFPAQRADQLVIGMQHRFSGRWAVRTEAYYRALRQLRPRFENAFDPLAVIPELEPDRVRIAPERASARGLELSIAYTVDELDAWASYVLSRVEDRVGGADVPRSWDQRHALQLGAAWDGARWNLAAAISVHTGWPTTDLTLDLSDPAPPAAVIGARNALRLGTYASLDMRASRTLPLRVGALEVFVEASNATNRANPCCGDFELEQGAGGAWILQRDTDHWLPRLGSVGVLWKF